ncbi:12424_t:CDS:1, partial [Acaulospora colombiana]
MRPKTRTCFKKERTLQEYINHGDLEAQWDCEDWHGRRKIDGSSTTTPTSDLGLTMNKEK